jgi:Oligosaccharide biosynthesis protein Alg14 like
MPHIADILRDGECHPWLHKQSILDAALDQSAQTDGPSQAMPVDPTALAASPASDSPAGSEALASDGKVLLVASSGGHLLQLLQLADLWPRERRHWVSFRKSDAVSLLAGERVTWAHHPTNRNLPNLLRNFAVALPLLRQGDVAAVVTTGAGVAVPFALAGRLLGVNVVYIESMARITSPSLTGRLVYPFADTFIVQWPSLLRFFKRALCLGTVFDPA